MSMEISLLILEVVYVIHVGRGVGVGLTDWIWHITIVVFSVLSVPPHATWYSFCFSEGSIRVDYEVKFKPSTSIEADKQKEITPNVVAEVLKEQIEIAQANPDEENKITIEVGTLKLEGEFTDHMYLFFYNLVLMNHNYSCSISSKWGFM